MSSEKMETTDKFKTIFAMISAFLAGGWSLLFLFPFLFVGMEEWAMFFFFLRGLLSVLLCGAWGYYDGLNLAKRLIAGKGFLSGLFLGARSGIVVGAITSALAFPSEIFFLIVGAIIGLPLGIISGLLLVGLVRIIEWQQAN
jgi:hypothetical protein